MLPRTKAQRLIVFIGLIVVAWSLHVMFCEWRYRAEVSASPFGRYDAIVGWTHDGEGTLGKGGGGSGPGATVVRTGLFAEDSMRKAQLLGIMLPLALLATAAYLWFGWRYDDRRRGGRCVRCGYDMSHAQNPSKPRLCPECGTNQPSDSLLSRDG